MRRGWLMLTALMLVISATGTGEAAQTSGSSVALTKISHALDDRMLVVSGWVENQGPNPVSRLVIDVKGFDPSGNLAVFGSDGIPWEIQAAGAERFSVGLPIQTQLIRDYVVQLTSLAFSPRLLANQRRSVDVELYRPLLFSRVNVNGDIRAGLLTVRSRADGLPINRVIVRATVLLNDLIDLHAKVFTLDLDVPADGTATVLFGFRTAMLLTLRVVDIRLKTVWSD